jgi:hypothetical protein
MVITETLSFPGVPRYSKVSSYLWTAVFMALGE